MEPGGVSVGVLRQLFRNLQLFRAIYETDGVDEVVSPDGSVYNLFDLEYLYSTGLMMLSVRQRQAIRLCLVANMVERDVAVAMAIKPSNPVSMYANDGLKKLVALIEAGELPRFRVRRINRAKRVPTKLAS